MTFLVFNPYPLRFNTKEIESIHLKIIELNNTKNTNNRKLYILN